MNGCATKCIIENQDVGKMLIKWKSKAPFGQKVQCHLVESLHFNTMVVAYSHHFGVYSHNRKQII
jgi:hypothetical protein